MFRTYDFNKAKEIVLSKKENLSRASLGMHEDWFWTADTIWENGEFSRVLPDNADEIYIQYSKKRGGGMSLLSKEADEYNNIMIGGIYGSSWATPTIHLEYNDGSDEFIECCKGEDTRTDVERITEVASQQAFWTSGVLSGPAQDNIKPLKK